jgi:nicotinate-nucleotide adenylyltransferase
VPAARPPESQVTPVPVPAGTREVLLVGGLFDPPHPAHVALPLLARERAAPGAWLVYVPAARSPLKDAATAPDADRVRMLLLALAGTTRAGVWTDELDRVHASGEPSYWIDTLARARASLGPSASLRFVIGADQAAQFHRWKSPREILALSEPLVLLRAPFTTRGSLLTALTGAHFWSRDELEAWSRRIVDGPLMPDNSTQAREALASGREPAPLDPAVRDYIRQHDLYR